MYELVDGVLELEKTRRRAAEIIGQNRPETKILFEAERMERCVNHGRVVLKYADQRRLGLPAVFPSMRPGRLTVTDGSGIGTKVHHRPIRSAEESPEQSQ